MPQQVAVLYPAGQRMRWPWMQMMSGDWFDVVTVTDIEADAIRNTLSASASSISRRTGMKFQQRRIERRLIRVTRTDGVELPVQPRRGPYYVPDDPLEIVSMVAGTFRYKRAEDDAELARLSEMFDHGIEVATKKNWGKLEFRKKIDPEARTITLYCVNADPA